MTDADTVLGSAEERQQRRAEDTINDPAPVDDHALRAVRMAIAIRDRMEAQITA